MNDPLPADLSPGITALVLTHSGADRLELTLQSLADQSLDRTQFEVVVVLTVPDGIDAISQQLPDLREVHAPGADVSVSMNEGVAAARREFVTVIDSGDRISPDYLAQLLTGSDLGAVAHGFVADVGTDDSGRPDFDTEVNRSLGPAIAQTQHPASVPASLSLNAAKSVSTQHARAIHAREGLSAGTESLFWHELVNTFRLPIRVLPSSAHAVYYRSPRSGVSNEQAMADRLDTMEALAPLATDSTGYVAPAARENFDAQTRAIGRYLGEHPDEHQRVLDLISGRHLPDFTVEVLNRGRARDLATCYCFVPSNNTSALVAARRVRERGVCVDLITHDMTGTFEDDLDAAEIAAPYVGNRLTVGGRPRMAQWAAIADYCREGAEAIELWEASQGPYRSVYSRAMWPASHVLAALHKARNPDVKWIAEFSDPLSINMKGQPRTSKRGTDSLSAELDSAVAAAGHPPANVELVMPWIEHLAYALADEIVFTNEHQMSTMLEHVDDESLLRRVREHAVISPHPTLPAAFYERSKVTYELDPARAHLAYFGAFYATRGLTEVTDALHALPKEIRRRVQLHVFTKDPATLRSDLKKAGLSDLVVANEYVPYLDFLHLTTLFDCLVVNDARTSDHHAVNPYLPSKISDYRGSGRPIWAIVEPGSTMSQTDTEFRTQLGDVPGAVDVLTNLARSVKAEPAAR